MPLRVQLGGADLTIAYDADSGAVTASVSGERVPVYNGYWFAWAAFHPKTAIGARPQPRPKTRPKATIRTAPAAGSRIRRRSVPRQRCISSNLLMS